MICILTVPSVPFETERWWIKDTIKIFTILSIHCRPSHHQYITRPHSSLGLQSDPRWAGSTLTKDDSIPKSGGMGHKLRSAALLWWKEPLALRYPRVNQQHSCESDPPPPLPLPLLDCCLTNINKLSEWWKHVFKNSLLYHSWCLEFIISCLGSLEAHIL